MSAHRRRPFSHLVEDLCGAALFHRRAIDPAAVRRLREDVAAIALEPDASGLWHERRAELRRLLTTRDPRDFLRWAPVRTTMVKRGKAIAAHEFRVLRAQPDWRDFWRPALRESTVGRPRPFPRYPRTSGTLIHQASHLLRLRGATGVDLARMPFIAEFGGGYGSLCRLVHQLGFRGTYVIFDLPEVSALQRFYLGAVGLPVADERRGADGTIHTVSDVGALAARLRGRGSGASAFVAAWSLGESPVALRHAVLPLVADFDAFLVGHTERFEAIDNVAFFTDWRRSLPTHTWHTEPIPHLNKAEWYLFGVRADQASHG